MATFWAQRNSRERLLILLALAAGIVGIPIMLISPEKSSGKLLSASKAGLEIEKAKTQIQTLDKETKRLKPELEKLVYKEPPEEVVPSVIKTLQTVAKQSGIHLREIKPLRARQLSTVTKVPMTVRFTGQF